MGVSGRMAMIQGRKVSPGDAQRDYAAIGPASSQGSREYTMKPWCRATLS